MADSKKHKPMKIKSFKDLHNHPANNLAPRDAVPLAQSGAPPPAMDFSSMGNTGNSGAEPHTNRMT
jgi:hypothetical protein